MNHFNFSSNLTFIYQNVSIMFTLCTKILGSCQKVRDWASPLLRPAMITVVMLQYGSKSSDQIILKYDNFQFVTPITVHQFVCTIMLVSNRSALLTIPPFPVMLSADSVICWSSFASDSVSLTESSMYSLKSSKGSRDL